MNMNNSINEIISEYKKMVNESVKASNNQLETLRNISNQCEKLGYKEAAKAGFTAYNKGRIGQISQEEANARIHSMREIIRTYHGSKVADSIA